MEQAAATCAPGPRLELMKSHSLEVLKQLLLIVQVFQPKHFTCPQPKILGKSHFFTLKRQVTNDFDRHGIPLDFVWLDLETGWWSIYRAGWNDSRDNIFQMEYRYIVE